MDQLGRQRQLITPSTHPSNNNRITLSIEGPPAVVVVAAGACVLLSPPSSTAPPWLAAARKRLHPSSSAPLAGPASSFPRPDLHAVHNSYLALLVRPRSVLLAHARSRHERPLGCLQPLVGNCLSRRGSTAQPAISPARLFPPESVAAYLFFCASFCPSASLVSRLLQQPARRPSAHCCRCVARVFFLPFRSSRMS